jgi:chorismate mutase
MQLSEITEHLEAIEETIVFKLIDRAQYRENAVIYQSGKSGFSGWLDKSLFEIRLRYHEEMDAQFGRFCVPEERPFTPELPLPRRKVLLPETGLAIDSYDTVNLTEEISAGYRRLVAELCVDGDDGQYGSSVEHDVYALQAIARRVHYGSLYVAESKFISAPQCFGALIDARDGSGLLGLLTRKDVEEKILMRVREKTVAVQATVNSAVRRSIDPDIVVEFYRDCIIPLTKKGEVLYLLNRKAGNGI